MATIGAIAPNLHEGTRSEYLAHYVFSAMGTSVPVPHPEDAGIDLHCTLGERVGQRLHVTHYYSVQVKSTVAEISFETAESVRWLFGHHYPLFLCFIEKKAHRIAIYHTVPVTMCYAKEGVESVSLIPEPDPKGFHVIESGEKIEMRVGPPIIEFVLTDLEDPEWVKKMATIMRAWIDIDQANIDHKAFGVTLFRVPQTYVTNEVPTGVWQTMGNFKELATDPARRRLALDSLFKILSQLVCVATGDGDTRRVKLISDFAGPWLEIEEDKGLSKPVHAFATLLNSARHRLGLSGGIKVTEHRADGSVTGFPIAREETSDEKREDAG